MLEKFAGYDPEDIDRWIEQNIAKLARIELAQENARRLKEYTGPNTWPEIITVICGGKSRTRYA